MRILLGVDYRGGYRNSIKTLMKMKLTDSSVTLVHGWGSKHGNNILHSSVSLLGSVLEIEGANLMRNAEAEAFGVLSDVSTQMIGEQAVTALVQEARRQEADLIVVSPTVRSNSNRAYGASTHALVESMPTSLLIVRESFDSVPIKEVLFLCDETDTAARAMKSFPQYHFDSVESVTILRSKVPELVTSSSYSQVRQVDEVLSTVTCTQDCHAKVVATSDPEVLLQFIEKPSGRMIVTHSLYKNEQVPLQQILAGPTPVMLIKTY